MKAVRISLELAIVPIRKFLIIFYVYMRLLFGRETRPPVKDPKAGPTFESENVRKNKHLLYLKEYIDVFINQENQTPRFHLRTTHPVESFYKRHMTTDQPIPQVIVVGILRVLLTTCPNNQKNAGGIDLHAEWGACLNFLRANREFFKERGFKSKVFSKTDCLMDATPKKSRDPQEDGEDEADEQPEEEEDPDFSKMPEYQFEIDRHRIIVAMVISDFFLFMLKHFKANHLAQFMYLSALLVDANGVLVLLKFLNQDFGKINFEQRKDAKLPFLKVSADNNMTKTMEYGINSMLRLMYKTTKN